MKEEATQMLPNSGVTNYQHPIVPIMFTFGIAIFASSLKRRKKIIKFRSEINET